jgi:hypothetical protein
MRQIRRFPNGFPDISIARSSPLSIKLMMWRGVTLQAVANSPTVMTDFFGGATIVFAGIGLAAILPRRCGAFAVARVGCSFGILN